MAKKDLELVTPKLMEMEKLMSEIRGLLGKEPRNESKHGRNEAPQQLTEKEMPDDLPRKKSMIIAVMTKKRRGMNAKS